MVLSRAQISDLLHEAPKEFSRLFEQLLLVSLLPQRELSRRATALKRSLVDDQIISKGDSLIGSQAQPTISNVIDGQQRPTPGQLWLWLEVVKEWFHSPSMIAKIQDAGVPQPRYPHELIEKDIWRLALQGTIEEIHEAYERWKNIDLFEYLTQDPNTDQIPCCLPQLEHQQ